MVEPQRQVIGDINKPRGHTKSNYKEMLIRKGIIDGKIVALNYEPREMVSYDIFSFCLIFDFNIELLQEKNPPDEAMLSILLL